MSSDAPVSTVPAGWYPDPLGTSLLRWWTGVSWSERLEHRRPEIHLAPGAVDHYEGDDLPVRMREFA
ncbi:DUF2510 domain-containing protein [Ruicaihuangia caeni]|uniref:DUF2510 domain-containing protein n=1 Tax=Ruicaihuangia caeni TaxID=3042517 RepID=A0AAW6T1X6_9MICO|nr:DUF2510 domain-containing protein [Klugiella sp. YN-L-19]MDI2097792.1 DUF2510 domain-containing protein [Klugiella sp. YN-L-19]